MLLTNYYGKKVFKLSMTGEIVKVFPAGQFMLVTSCKNQLYFTTKLLVEKMLQFGIQMIKRYVPLNHSGYRQ